MWLVVSLEVIIDPLAISEASPWHGENCECEQVALAKISTVQYLACSVIVANCEQRAAIKKNLGTVDYLIWKNKLEFGF